MQSAAVQEGACGIFISSRIQIYVRYKIMHMQPDHGANEADQAKGPFLCSLGGLSVRNPAIILHNIYRHYGSIYAAAYLARDGGVRVVYVNI